MARPGSLHHVAVTVTDVHRSASWYKEVLAFEEVFREDGDTRKAVVMRWPQTGPIFAVVWHAEGNAGTGFDPRTVGLDHLSFTAASMEDMQAWADRLDEHGVEHLPIVEIPVGAIMNFKDPDGIALSFFWDRPSDPAG